MRRWKTLHCSVPSRWGCLRSKISQTSFHRSLTIQKKSVKNQIWRTNIRPEVLSTGMFKKQLSGHKPSTWCFIIKWLSCPVFLREISVTHLKFWGSLSIFLWGVGCKGTRQALQGNYACKKLWYSRWGMTRGWSRDFSSWGLKGRVTFLQCWKGKSKEQSECRE